jgi:hypothetical protein
MQQVDQRPKSKNKCKHCKEERPYAGKHEEDKCFYNKKYKGWRPSKICKELGIKSPQILFGHGRICEQRIGRKQQRQRKRQW